MTAPTTARRSAAAAVVVVIGVLAVVVAMWAIVADDAGEGPVIVHFTGQHGLHRGELREVAVLVGGLLTVVWGLWMGRSPR